MQGNTRKYVNNWVSRSSMYNFFNDDPIVDLLEEAQKVFPDMNIVEPRGAFDSFIMDQGHAFESLVYQRLEAKFGSDFLNLNASFKDLFNKNSHKRTVQILEKGVPIIAQVVLKDDRRQTYGLADLLVRSDYIDKLTDCLDLYVLDKEWNKRGTSTFKHGYSYIVVDIKFKTLEVKKNGFLNAEYKFYKAQTLLYSQMLSNIQGWMPPYAFILGRKFKQNGEVFYDAFHSLGPIDFSESPGLPDDIEKAILWVRLVRHNAKYLFESVMRGEIPHDYARPNMCKKSRADKVKKMIAIIQGDPTLYYQLGSKHRNLLLQKGLTMKDGPSVLEHLNLSENHYKKVLHQMTANPILPVKGTTMTMNSMGPYIVAVDFETLNEVMEDFSSFPEPNIMNTITMIGASALDIRSGIHHSTCFVIEKLDKASEFRMIRDFIQWLSKFEYQYVLHWGYAECSHWNKVMDRHENIPQIPWFDLCKFYESYSILPKNCYGFNLKEMHNSLFMNGLIKNKRWSGECGNGEDAMILFWLTNKKMKEEESKGIQKTFIEYPEIQSVLSYNIDDCDALLDLYNFVQDYYDVEMF